MRYVSLALPVIATSFLAAGSALAAPDVITSIKPVHSLVSAVMQGVATPQLIVDGAASPHTYSLRPSSADALEQADLVVWIGPEIETFLANSIETLAEDAVVLGLGAAPGLALLDQREGGAFDAHDHDDHDEDAHEEDHDDHAHDEHDLHVWLDPENAKVMLTAIVDTLSDLDPENAETYAANAQSTAAKFDTLTAEITAEMAPLADKPFIVFHDAYHYFENRFGLQAAGSITVSPDALPGVQRVAEIREKVTDQNAVCVFSEPQFEPRIISVVTEGTNVNSDTLDPLGADLENGPELYENLIRKMAQSFSDCLSD